VVNQTGRRIGMNGKAVKRKKKIYFNSDTVFYIVVYAAMVFVLIVTLYPLWFTLIASVSDPSLVATGNVLLLPKAIQFTGYEKVFGYRSVWTAYRNTIYYACLGTFISVAATLTAAFVFSRKGLKGSRVCMMLILFTMYFGGGLIPTYFNIRNLHMLNTVWALVIPGMISGFNLIIARTFMRTTIPEELSEAATIDGCSPIQYYLRVIIPLSTPIIVVLALYNFVGFWNSYFDALIYLRDRDKYPLQLILREILVQSQVSAGEMNYMDVSAMRYLADLSETLKYALIIVSTIPILLIYPFVQRFFVKGVMIGAVKG
jgi:putative aldouronate transport system permease protein